MGLEAELGRIFGMPVVVSAVAKPGTILLRDGYHPNDPQRRCFTCGAAPTGSYRDGSPSYGCGPHPSIEATREQLEAWGLA